MKQRIDPILSNNDELEAYHKNQFNRWGFNRNPYFTNELNSGDLLANLFVGRRNERRRFINALDSGMNAFCIEGESFGIGKSTFFNRVALEIGQERKGFIVTGKIDFTRQTTPGDLLIDIMSQMEKAVEKARDVPEKVKKEVTNIITINETAKEKELSVLPSILGGSVSRGRVTREREKLTPGITGSIIIEIDELVHETTGKRFLIPIENLESSKIKSKYVIDAVEMLRDLTFYNSLYFFIGDAGLTKTLSGSGRLRSVLGDPIKVPPLTLKEFQDVVNIRLDYFSTPEKMRLTPIFPLDDDVIRYIYRKSKGDIRWALNFLHRIFQRMVNEGYPVREHNLADIEKILVALAWETFEELTPPLQRIIVVISRRGSSGPSSPGLIKETGFKTSYLNRNLNSDKIRSSPEILKRSKKARQIIYSLGYEMQMLKEYGKI